MRLRLEYGCFVELLVCNTTFGTTCLVYFPANPGKVALMDQRSQGHVTTRLVLSGLLLSCLLLWAIIAAIIVALVD